MEADDTQSAGELVAAYNGSIETVSVNLSQHDKLKKLGKWALHELKDRQDEECIQVALCC